LSITGTNAAKLKIVWQDPVMLQIGKGGISEGTVSEAKRLLKKHKIIKVRLLRSAGGDKHTKQGFFEDLCQQTGAKLAGIRGNTGVIYKLRKGQ
jgi:RNA-binding protein YhbY